MYDITIIGAGASGLACAIVSARRGKRVLILEKNNKVGKKLLATGNGKCNITNQKITLNRFYSNNPKFIEQVLYSYKDIKDFFKTIGLELIEAKEGKVFPMSQQAQSVVDLLYYESIELGIEILCDCRVEEIIPSKQKYKIIYSKGKIETKNLVIATGHQSAPHLGGVLDGVIFAKKLGHNIIKSYPSLVQLTSPMPKLKEIAGVKIESQVSLENITKQGDILFTNYGISGLAILDISRFVVNRLKYKKEVTLTLDFMPKITDKQLFSMLKKSLKKTQRPIDIWLEGFINKKLIHFILDSLKIKNLPISKIDTNILNQIIKQIKSFKFKVNGTRGFKGAEIATGGVDTTQINPKTMESKIHKRLYFIGEVLDIDADRGGFNLHFAWSSAIKAGEAI